MASGRRQDFGGSSGPSDYSTGSGEKGESPIRCIAKLERKARYRAEVGKNMQASVVSYSTGTLSKLSELGGCPPGVTYCTSGLHVRFPFPTLSLFTAKFPVLCLDRLSVGFPLCLACRVWVQTIGSSSSVIALAKKLVKPGMLLCGQGWGFTRRCARTGVDVVGVVVGSIRGSVPVCILFRNLAMGYSRFVCVRVEGGDVIEDVNQGVQAPTLHHACSGAAAPAAAGTGREGSAPGASSSGGCFAQVPTLAPVW